MNQMSDQSDQLEGQHTMPDGTPEPPISQEGNPVISMPAITAEDVANAQAGIGTFAAGATEEIAALANAATNTSATTEKINSQIQEAARAAAKAAGVSTRTAPEGAALSDRPVPSSPINEEASDGTTTIIAPAIPKQGE